MNSSIIKNNKPELFFLVLILIVGTLLVLIIPIGAGMDEEAHLSRIWEMSSGELIPNKMLDNGAGYPCVFLTSSYITDPFFTPINFNEWIRQFKDHIDWSNFCNYSTRARYFPSLYIVQAGIMGVAGRLFNFPVPLIYYLLRFSYLITYSILIYFSIKLIPIGKWLLGVLSVLPTSLIQASIINPETITNGISFAFIAWVVYLLSAKITFRKREWAINFLFVMLICTLKPNALFLLSLFLIIPKSKFGSRNNVMWFTIYTIAMIFIISLGWNYLTSGNQLLANAEETYSIKNQVVNILHNPSHFIFSVFYTLRDHTGEYIRDAIGATGYNFWNLPIVIYVICGLSIAISIIFDESKAVFKPQNRLYFLILFLITNFSIIVIFYLLYNNPQNFDIPGVLGRYFIFSSPLIFLSILPNTPLIRLRAFWLKLSVLLSSFLILLTLFLVYHVACGSSFISAEACALPRYRNWSPETGLTFSLSSNEFVKQTFIAKCNRLSSIIIYSDFSVLDQNPVIQLKDQNGNEVISSNIEEFKKSDEISQIVYSFPVIDSSRDKKYTIYLSATKNMKWQIIYTNNDEYKDGELSIDNIKIPGDLLFQYSCKVGILNPQ